MRHDITFIRMAAVKILTMRSADKNVEQLELSYTADGKIK
jgi:hypothetical protein